jgi:DNA topoisomerase VI subunit B
MIIQTLSQMNKCIVHTYIHTYIHNLDACELSRILSTFHVEIALGKYGNKTKNTLDLYCMYIQGNKQS